MITHGAQWSVSVSHMKLSSAELKHAQFQADIFLSGRQLGTGRLSAQTDRNFKTDSAIDKDDIMNVINTVSLYLALSSLRTKLCTPLLLIQHFVSVIVLLVRL